MKVSILVPIYGVEKYIERCARSLFEQSYQNLEYVFVDDCSQDQSITILNKIIENYPNRKSQIRIIHHERNRGLAAARNTGVKNATGNFILHVDSDDRVDVALVQKLVAKQSVNNADIICFDIKVDFRDHAEYYKNRDYLNGKDLSLKMLFGSAPHQLCGHLIRRSLYIDNNIQAKEGVNQSEDLQVMPRLAYYAKNINTLHESLYYYDRTTDNSYSNNYTVNSYNQILETYKILHDFFADKEYEFADALQINEINSLVKGIKHFSKCVENDSYFKKLVLLASKFDKKYKKKVVLYNRPILLISNRRFVSFYSTLLKNTRNHFI